MRARGACDTRSSARGERGEASGEEWYGRGEAPPAWGGASGGGGDGTRAASKAGGTKDEVTAG
eukprot:3679668-Prymnesium_polylepis.2